MAEFATPSEDVGITHASRDLDPATKTSCDPNDPKGGRPEICRTNPAKMNDAGITGPLAEAMCNGKDDCANGITGPDKVNWCGSEEDELEKSMTCGGKNHNTKGKPDASCTVSKSVEAACGALNATTCAGDSKCVYSGDSCGPTTSADTCAAAASSPSACEAAGDCTSGEVISSGSTCKTRLQCVRTWLASQMKIFAVVMALFLFLESLMVVGTFNLGRKTTQEGGFYQDSGEELTADMTAADALSGYEKSFK